MKKIFYLAMLFAMPAMAQETTTFCTLEDTGVEFNEQGFWNGDTTGTPEEGDWGEDLYKSTFTSGLITGHCDYSVMSYGTFTYDWWGGVSLSQRTGTELYSLDDQYNNITGTGVNGTETFGVIFGDGATIDIDVDGGAEVRSIYVANSAYTMTNVLVGDGYSPKFANEGDHIYLVITGTKANGATVSKTVKLAEYTTELQYLSIWTKIDLSFFGKDVTKLTFTFDAHNSGVPQYACIDEIEIVTDGDVTTAIDNISTTTAAGEVYDLNGRQMNTMHKGLNIVRMADGSFRKVMK